MNRQVSYSHSNGQPPRLGPLRWPALVLSGGVAMLPVPVCKMPVWVFSLPLVVPAGPTKTFFVACEKIFYLSHQNRNPAVGTFWFLSCACRYFFWRRFIKREPYIVAVHAFAVSRNLGSGETVVKKQVETIELSK